MRKCGYVAIIGKPNAGKSTLMNAFLEYDLSIVNRKAQTTRNKILGIHTENNIQIVFIDTPGLFEPKYELQKFMMTELKSSFNEADMVLHLIDVSEFNIAELKSIEEKFRKEFKGKKRIIVLNKIDLVQQDDVMSRIIQLKEEFGFETIIPVSAKEEFNLGEVKREITDNLPVSEFFFDEEILTDKPEKFFVAEIIRQKILELYQDEVPYSVYVDIVEFIERKESKDYINAEIVLERESQKVIFIGRSGEKIKTLGRAARESIEKFLKKEVYLKLFVKVRKDWRKDKRFLREAFKQ
ncbi:MAG: GTPase Era [Ignavibacteriae bacterium]|nr:GTPase Era [Ignavibacteriota bacterium]